MSTNVGLLTTAGLAMPSSSAIALTRCVLPAPSGPIRATTAPGKRSAARRRPSARVPSRSATSMAVRSGMASLRGGLLVVALGLLPQVRLDELVQVAVEHLVDLRGLHVGADVLDERIRLHDVIANLRPERHLALVVV